MKTIEAPDGFDEIVKTFGNPDENGDHILDLAFIQSHLQVFNFNIPLRLAWGDHRLITRFQAHALIGDIVMEALDEFFAAVGEQKARDETWDYWGGCFNFRPNSNDKSKLSIHSWGAAVDINPHLNPNGQKECKQPVELMRAFISRGGRWVSGDWMHCQFCWGY